MLKHFIILVMSGFLGACSSFTKPPMIIEQGHPIKQYRGVASFNQLDVQGSINLNLHTGYKKPQVILTGDPRDLMQVTTVVTNSTLHITLGKGYPHYGLLTADIRGQFLNRIHYDGAGIITGKQLHTSFLDLYLANQGTTILGGSIGLQKLVAVGDGVVKIDGLNSRNLKVILTGNPKVQLSGFVSLGQLIVKGHAWFSLYWVKSNHLLIRAKQSAKIQLAGVVNKLDVELWNNAQFKGRYLRAQRSFVKTHGKSVAEISAIHHQSNLASDSSDIYYYNIPTTRADFMALDGSVLNMREWGPLDTEDYTLYNKQYP